LWFLGHKHLGAEDGISFNLKLRRDGCLTLDVALGPCTHDTTMRKVVICYIILSHVFLQATSPAYLHEVSRFRRAAAAAWDQSTAALFRGRAASAAGSSNVTLELPRSGVYASTYFLGVIQQHMELEKQPGNTTSEAAAALYSTSSTKLIAYMSATDLMQGGGWAARAAFFSFLLAPRYLLSAPGAKFWREVDMFHLAGADLPAVGLYNRSEVVVNP
jgi:hypothetical protein